MTHQSLLYAWFEVYAQWSIDHIDMVLFQWSAHELGLFLFMAEQGLKNQWENALHIKCLLSFNKTLLSYR